MPVVLRTSYQAVLRCYRVLSDPVLSDGDKVDLCLHFLLHGRPLLRLISRKRKTQLFTKLFDSYVNIDVQNNGKEGPRAIDFNQDAGYIYSAFWQCYDIDLLGKRGRRLHWWKFVALLSGLSDDTRIMQIVDIRTRPLPKPTKYNADTRLALLKAKSRYSLRISEEERQAQYQQGLAKVAMSLIQLAGRR